MVVIKGVGYCSDLECHELAQLPVACDKPECELKDKGEHYHCSGCGKVLGSAKETRKSVRVYGKEVRGRFILGKPNRK
jgi:hypothetical protein